MSTQTQALFALGAYLGGPDNSSAVNEAAFEANYTSFSQVLKASPKFLVSYVDQNQPISNWVANAGWGATSAAQSADAAGMTPVIGLPMVSRAGTMSSDQYFKAFASGQYDAVIQGVVRAWAQAGFKTQYWRPGWEMNLAGTVNYAGDDAQTQSDWVAAFQHISTVLHQAGQQDGVNVQVIWNPGTTNYSNAEATTNLYPGNSYVDLIGADAYADIYPYSDSSGTPTYHDWSTGAEDTSLAQFIADPVNREHYWSNPAATEWANDSSGGHALTLDQLLAFAKTQGKPFALTETGAGNSSGGHDVSDDAAFPQWLSQKLVAAQSAGVTVAFVNIWDSNGGGNYEFSNIVDDKPLEAAAWAQSFGGQVSAPASSSTPTLTVGVGRDNLVLLMSEDAWQGDAQFNVSVDGTQIGGTQTITASRSAGQTQTVSVSGEFGGGTHVVAVDFLNDAYGGTPVTDRNLYVSAASFDGIATSASLSLMSSGTQSLLIGSPFAPSVTIGSGRDVLALTLSEDRYLGDAQFTISVDGTQIGGTLTMVASHAAGQSQVVDVAGDFGAGTHAVAIDFLNDLYAGTPTTDRNLYVSAATYDGVTASSTSLSLMSAGTQTLSIGVPMAKSVTIGTGQDIITIGVSEDRYLADASFTVSVDGNQVGGTLTTPASHAAGQTQTVNIEGRFGAGLHVVGVDFLNDAYAGTPVTDRNLYVTSASDDGIAATNASLALMSAGSKTLTVGTTPTETYNPGAMGGVLTTVSGNVVDIGSGAVTINAAGGSVVAYGGAGMLNFIGGSGLDAVFGGAGKVVLTPNADTLNFTAGSGDATILAGAGPELFDFINGAASSTTAVSNYDPTHDSIQLRGYAAGSATQTIVNGSTQIILPDQARITLVGTILTTPQSVYL